VNDENPTTNYSWVEEFDTLNNALKKGWVVVNNSRPLGAGSWSQGAYVFSNGKITGFPAASYTYSGNDYVTCGYYAGDGLATLSAWLITPPTMIKNGDQLIFHSRTIKNPADYPDRMQVRMNSTDASIDVGNGPLSDLNVATAVGKFTSNLLDINPQLLETGPDSYPAAWRRYTLTISNLPQPVLGRFAFRYFVTDGGTSGANSDAIGVDSVAFVSK
jgi:hypothetical protein